MDVDFTVLCLCYIKKLQLLVVKKKKNYDLLHYTSIFMSSKSVSQIFKILFQTGDTDIFVRFGFFFSRHVQLKSCFSDEKTSSVKSETHFSRETIEN